MDSARNLKSRRYDRRRLNGNRRFGREMRVRLMELAERAQARVAELAGEARDASAIEAMRLEASAKPPVDPFEEIKARFATISAAPGKAL